ncbi:HAD hydrolase-like protein [Derxia gummosa]|uniref:HAD hydrolase-like protein n=1 Tax=Derxia gummosa DSM 723 TaxID=1121388 RepID=A0A8B6X0W9_9BURK|nr:HAD hydrolase-like protein [Derxia gummosa]
MSTPPALVILDFDGTLADSFGFLLSVHNRLARAHGFREVADDEIELLRRLGTREMLRHTGLPLWKLPRVAADFIRLMGEADGIAPFAGIDAALARLAARGVKLAVASSNGRANVERVLGATTLARFAELDCGASVFGKAPRLGRIARRLGVAPRDALFVGDQVADLHAAREAGMAAGAVAWGYTRLDTLLAHGPQRTFGSVEELGALAG